MRRAPKSSCRAWTTASGCRRSGRSPSLDRSAARSRTHQSHGGGGRTRSSRRRRCRCARSGSTSTISSSTLFGSRHARRAGGASATTSRDASGDVDASGLSAGIPRRRSPAASTASVEYSLTRASGHRSADRRLHAVLRAVGGRASTRSTFTTSSTSIETECPKRRRACVVLYRVSNGFARPAQSARRAFATAPIIRSSTRASTCRCASRCRSWTSAPPSGRCWSRSATSSARPAPDQSIYDELLVVRPPEAHRRRPDAQVLSPLTQAWRPPKSIHDIETAVRMLGVPPVFAVGDRTRNLRLFNSLDDASDAEFRV